MAARNRTTSSSTSSSASSSSTSSSSTPIARLQNIASHMSSPISTTSFPAEAVPKAPEDPLFGLMAAYRADESKDKVDLVGQPFAMQCNDSKLRDANSLVVSRVLEHTETTMRNPGFFLWSRRCVYALLCSWSTPRRKRKRATIYPAARAI